MVGETPLHCAVNHSSLLTAGMLISCLSDNQLIHYSSLLRRLQVSIQFITFNSVDLLHCVFKIQTPMMNSFTVSQRSLIIFDRERRYSTIDYCKK